MSILKVFGQHDEKTLAQLEDVASRAEHVSLMADGHLGYIMPIGGVAAYEEKVSVCGVGFDIACGNAAIRTDLSLPDLTGGLTAGVVEAEPWRVFKCEALKTAADEIWGRISFGVGRKNLACDAPLDDPLFDDDAWQAIPPGNYRDSLLQKARTQLGTVGSGNHYVDLFVDEEDLVWVGVHFGSRGFGHTVASDYLSLSQGGERGQRMEEVEVLMPLDSELGREYWALMQLAGRYAYAGREWVARKVVRDVLGANETDLVHNHHNFAWREKHFGRDYIVVRKGATPAFPGQRGFVGGSMGDGAVIVEGSRAENPDQVEAMYSTVHGAGRVMSRTQAAGKINRKTGEVKSPGLVSWDMLNEWLGKEGVILRGGGLDESPHAYRRLPRVLEAQGQTINMLHYLKPLVVVMAGANEFDPYKD